MANTPQHDAQAEEEAIRLAQEAEARRIAVEEETRRLAAEADRQSIENFQGPPGTISLAENNARARARGGEGAEIIAQALGFDMRPSQPVREDVPPIPAETAIQPTGTAPAGTTIQPPEPVGLQNPGLLPQVLNAPTPGRPGEDINIQLARSRLLEPNLPDNQRDRLNAIIQGASTPKDREVQRRFALAQANRLAQFGASRLNPPTEEEFNSAVSAIAPQLKQFGIPLPTQLRRAKEESEDAQLYRVNAADALAKEYAITPEFASYLLVPDKDTGQVDILKAMEVLEKRSKPSKEELSNLRDQESRLSRQIKEFGDDPLVFNQRTGALLSREDAKDDAQIAAIRDYEILLSKRRNVQSKLEGFNEQFEKSRLRSLELPSQIAQSVQPSVQPAGGNIAPPKTIRFQNTAEVPYQLQEGDDPSAIAQAAAEQAKATGQNVYVIHPVSKKRMTFRP